MTKFFSFLSEVKREGHKVTWPTRKETMMGTVMVLILAALAAVFFMFVDWVLGSSVRALLQLGA